MNKITKVIEIICVIVIAVAVVFLILHFHKSTTISNSPVATVLYSCDGGKTITASYYQGATAPTPASGQEPTPTGSVSLTLADGSTMTLAQTISADGARYANADESFVFWEKGNSVMVLENGAEKNYTGCIAVSPEDSLPQIYATSTMGFSLRLPGDFAVDESYKYQEMGPGKDISGVKFTIPASMATGTNLSSDTYLSVEQIPNVADCEASLFLDPQHLATTTITDNGVDYSVASSTGAGAGNRYEETVYALPATNPCTAVRYFIHYGVIENYPAGTVREFDPQALTSTFNTIRRTLLLAQ
jgi:membrane-bound inhibitor of C-type lysozyme